MTRARNWKIGVVFLFLTLPFASWYLSASQAPREEQRTALTKAHKDGNYKDAYEGLRKLALDPKDDPLLVGKDMDLAVDCLRKLGRGDELEEFREAVVEVHKKNWRLLQAAAKSYANIYAEHYGYITAGKFFRGYRREGGQYIYTMQRDRVRALQLMQQALEQTKGENNLKDLAQFHVDFANIVLNGAGSHAPWRLQYLSDLSKLPDYDEPNYYYYFNNPGAAVDADGNPIYHRVPKSYASAQSDGERWRWLLTQAAELDSTRISEIDMIFAGFLKEQFGVQTMGYRFTFRETASGETQAKTGTFALHTLKDDETIARLATGIKRFKLPDEFNFIKIYERVADRAKSDSGAKALENLARCFEDRRQYEKSAKFWKRVIADYGPGTNNVRQNALDQIIGNWGRFEPGKVQPAGKSPTIDFRFRNGSKVSFEATEIKVGKLLDDVKAHLKSNPQHYVDPYHNSIDSIGYRLVENQEKQYLGEKAAQWSMELKPRPAHADERVTVTAPLKKPGAYLVTAKMADGNTSRIIVWVADTVIIRKQLAGQIYYFVADAVTGQPISKADLEFFGFSQVALHPPAPAEVVTKEFNETADNDGQVIIGAGKQNLYYWLITARKKADKDGFGSLAYLGFTGVWYGHGGYYDANQKARDEIRGFIITDRPVYRPEQKVHFKFWARHVRYDLPDTSDYAGQTFKVLISNPKGDTIYEKSLTADEFGGLADDYVLPKGAMLGNYQVCIPYMFPYMYPTIGGGSFRVEEYKKPEFEVIVEAPKEPVSLGETINATIKAKYYFGAPVTHAKVKYKVMRTDHTAHWYPRGDWDWLYGRGYWWFAGDYPWYPGWADWGCKRPWHFWGRESHQPPEVVMENEVAIGSDGTVKVAIDTLPAKELHGDVDHKYSITAEVVDESRRTIVGSGDVLVARKPFRVYAWVDRGYYQAGDTVKAQFCAQTLDNKPVAQARGELKLFQITYNAKSEPVEKLVESWTLDTDAQGKAQQQLKAAKPGQYRLSYTVTDAKAAEAAAKARNELRAKIIYDAKKREQDQFRKLPLAIPPEHKKDKAEELKNLFSGKKDPQEELEKLISLNLKNHTIEGAYLFVVRGEGFTGKDFRFNDIELIADRKEYKPGENVKLLVNVNRNDGVVLLFTRPENGVYLAPKVIRLKGKSASEEIAVAVKDMPNFFIEAVTIADGRVHSDMRELIVPPEKRVLNVEVLPSQKEYKPGQKATVKVKLTDLLGKPFVGQTVVTMYDKSVEYISGGSNVPEIKSFFWNWRRHHYPHTESSLDHWFGNLLRQKEVAMSNLGRFGGQVFEKAASDNDAPAAPGSAGNKDMNKKSDTKAPRAPEAGQERGKGGQGEGEPPLVQPTIRKNFADTAFWNASLKTDKDGLAEVSLTMPENLTAWMIRVWGMGHGTRVGQGTAVVTTKKDLIVRLQAPRFFTQKDEVVLSANVHNYYKKEKNVEVSLHTEGGTLAVIDETTQKLIDDLKAQMKKDQPGEMAKLASAIEALEKRLMWPKKDITIPAGGEQRVDWRVKVVNEGEAVVRMTAYSYYEHNKIVGEMAFEKVPTRIPNFDESDAMEMRFPCYVHGMSKMESFTGVIPAGATPQAAKITFNVPTERRVNQTVLEVRYSPTLAGAMVDALPYLADYPYGCTEQTLNRFLATVITQRILQDMKLDLKEIQKHQTNLNSQELGNDKDRIKKGWRKPNPVFDEAEVKNMTDVGVRDLAKMQLSDGGWGWFSGYDEHSYPHTTATVVHGLQIARKNGVKLPPGMLERGIYWLKNYQAQELVMLKNAPSKTKPWKEHADNLDALVYMLLVDGDSPNADMRDFLYRDRTELAVYAKAMYGLALHKEAQMDRLDMILKNIEQYVVQDKENQTAYLRLPANNYWWYWYGSEIEADAYYLKLLARTSPKDSKAAGLVKYLLNNRRHATYWNCTRDTAICIEAMADYLKASGEDRPDMTIEVWLDGKKLKDVHIDAKNLFSFDNRLLLLGDAVTNGKHTLEIKRSGTGPVYFNAYLTNFTLEDFITKAGLEVRVNRKYYKLTRVDEKVKVPGSRGQALDQKVEKYERLELANLAQIKSGDLVEIELEIDSKNDYEYILFEDPKAAGFEPVEVRSGYIPYKGLSAYMEMRDEKVCFFVQWLSRGKHSISYRMRAETPGQFSALPARAYAMYAPELKGNSDEIKVRISD